MFDRPNPDNPPILVKMTVEIMVSIDNPPDGVETRLHLGNKRSDFIIHADLCPVKNAKVVQFETVESSEYIPDVHVEKLG